MLGLFFLGRAVALLLVLVLPPTCIPIRLRCRGRSSSRSAVRISRACHPRRRLRANILDLEQHDADDGRRLEGLNIPILQIPPDVARRLEGVCHLLAPVVAPHLDVARRMPCGLGLGAVEEVEGDEGGGEDEVVGGEGAARVPGGLLHALARLGFHVEGDLVAEEGHGGVDAGLAGGGVAAVFAGAGEVFAVQDAEAFVVEEGDIEAHVVG